MDNGLDKTDACDTQRDPTLEELAADYQGKALRHRRLQHRTNVVGDEMWKAQERLLAAARGDALFAGHDGMGGNIARQTIQPPVPTPASARLIKELAKDVVDLTGLGDDDKCDPALPDAVEEPLSRAEEVAAELKENATAAGADDEVDRDPFTNDPVDPGMDGPDPDPGEKMPGYPS